MSRSTLQFIVLLALGSFVACAHAGHIYHDTRVWAVQGPGGFYGLVESQGDPVGIHGHLTYETTVAFGPVQFALPCRAPLAALILISALAFVAWLFYSLIAHRRRHEISESQGA